MAGPSVAAPSFYQGVQLSAEEKEGFFGPISAEQENNHRMDSVVFKKPQVQTVQPNQTQPGHVITIYYNATQFYTRLKTQRTYLYIR